VRPRLSPGRRFVSPEEAALPSLRAPLLVECSARPFSRPLGHSPPDSRAGPIANGRFTPRGAGYDGCMAALVAVVLAALLLGFGFAFAAPWLVIVPIAIVMVFLAWLGTLGVAKRTPQEAVRQTRR